MTRTMRSAILLMLCVWLAAAGFARPLPSWSDPGFVGDLPYVKGNVEAKRVKEPVWFQAYRNMPDYLFDQIKTDSGSIASLEFKDGTQLGINENTTVLIDTNTSVEDITRRTLLRRILLTAGSLWCKVTKQEANESFTVQTRGGIVGVRGTEFVVSTRGDDEMVVDVLGGTVLIGPDADHLTRPVHAGEEVVVKAGVVVSSSEISMADFLRGYQNLDPAKNIRSALLCEGITIDGLYYSLFPGTNAPAAIFPGLKTAGFGAALFHPTPSGGSEGNPSPGFLREIRFSRPVLRPVTSGPSGSLKTYPPTFSWTAIPGAAQYLVVVAKTPIVTGSLQRDFVWMTRVDKTSVTYPDSAPTLSAGVTYYWAVMGLDANGLAVGGQSDSPSFTVPAASRRNLPYVALDHPSNESVADELPAFTFEPFPGAARYQVLIGTRVEDGALDSDYLVAVLNTRENAAAYGLENVALEPEKTYYWTVRPLDENGRVFAQSSPPMWFKITSSNYSGVGPRPVTPVLEATSKGAIRFEWVNWVPDIHGFRLVVSRNPDLHDPVLDAVTGNPWFEWTNSDISPKETYYWQVTTIREDGTAGVKGPEASFTTGP